MKDPFYDPSFMHALDNTGLIPAFVPIQAQTTTGDGLPGNPGLITASRGYLFNGSTWDRERSNTQEVVLVGAARTASINSSTLTNYNAKGAHVLINVSAIAATPSIIVSIQGRDSISGGFYDILISNSIVAVGLNVLKIYPGILPIANLSSNDILPRQWRVSVSNIDADSITYSVSAQTVI